MEDVVREIVRGFCLILIIGGVAFVVARSVSLWHEYKRLFSKSTRRKKVNNRERGMSPGRKLVRVVIDEWEGCEDEQSRERWIAGYARKLESDVRELVEMVEVKVCDWLCEPRLMGGKHTKVCEDIKALLEKYKGEE